MTAHLLSALPALANVVVRDTGDADAGWLFGLAGGVAIIALILGLLALALIVWAVIDLISNPRIDGVMKIVWALVIFFIPLIGSIIYLVVGRSASERASTAT